MVDRATAPDDALQRLCQTCLIRDELIAQLSLDLPERRRFTLVEDTVGISDFSSLYSVASKARELLLEERKSVLARYQRIVDETNRISVKQSAIKSALADDSSRHEAEVRLRELLKGADSNQTELIDVAKAAATQARRLVAQLRTLVERINQQKAFRSHNVDPNTQARIAQLEAEIGKLEKSSRDLATQVTEIEEQLNEASRGQDLQRALAELVRFGTQLGLNNGHCYLCGTQVDPADYAKHLEELSVAIATKSAHLDALTKEHQMLRSRQQDVTNELSRLLRQINQQRAVLQTDEQATRELILEATELGFQLDTSLETARIAERLEELQAWSDVLDDNVETLEASSKYSEIARLDDQEAKSREDLKRADKRLSILSSAMTAAKNIERTIKRVAGETLDRRLTALAPLLKELYVRLRPHTEWRELEYLIRGDVRRFLSLRVGDDLNPAFMFSSGQRRAAGLAFLLAINLSRTWSRLNTILLDDPIQHIDDFRAIHLVEVLAAIRRSGRQVICTVEDEALADLLCRRLRSEAHGDGARIDLEYEEGNGTTIRSIEMIGPMSTPVLVSA